MKIPEQIVEEIKYRNPIEDVISSYVTLKRAGSNMSGLCPFHSEKSPSFTVFTSGDPHFYCFGCGAGGDVITFIMRVENLDYGEALRFLAKRAGITLPENGEDTGGIKRQRIVDMNRDAARFFHAQLYKNPQALQYLYERSIPNPLIKHFGIGFAPDGFGALTSHMLSLGYTKEELSAGFLCGISKKNGQPYDYFRRRVIFPIINTSGDVIAFGGRVINKDDSPKYLNSSDTPAFNKRRNLFALNFAKNKCAEQLILCEGYMDVVTLHGAGFENAVATLGTAMTPEHAGIIKKYTKKVIISYDSDEAGQNAADKAFRLLGEVGVDTKILKMEGAKDPDEYIKKFGADKFRMLLEGSRSQFEFKLEGILKKYDINITDERIKAAADVCEFISGVYSAVERELYVTRAAEKLDLQAESLKRDVERRVRQKTANRKRDETQRIYRQTAGFGDRVNPETQSNLRAVKAEESILGILMLYPEQIKDTSKLISPDDFVTVFNRKVYAGLIENGGLDGEGYSVEEMGRLTAMKVGRDGLTNNGLDEIKALAGVIKSEKTRNTSDINELLKLKRGNRQ